MSITLLQAIAHDLSREGISYATVATFALKEGLSMEDAMLHLWIANDRRER